jgi:hypothetical protein
MKRLVCAVVAAMMFMGVAYGQVDSETKVIYKKVTEIEADGATIDGSILKPGMERVTGRVGIKFPPMINLKKNFDKELVASTDKL